MGDLRWAYENAAVRDAGALPPEPLDLDYGTIHDPVPKDLPRAVALGRPVTPADCGPVRSISRYGYLVRCPGRVRLQRAPEPRPDRHVSALGARFGLAEIEGDPWPVGDTGFIASWISGLEYVKIQTGVMIFFPRSMHLYQGPLPNVNLLGGPGLDVMAGLEYPVKSRIWDEDAGLAWSSINVIARLPQSGQEVEVQAGDPLCWIFPVLPRNALGLTRMTFPATGPEEPP